MDSLTPALLFGGKLNNLNMSLKDIKLDSPLASLVLAK